MLKKTLVLLSICFSFNAFSQDVLKYTVQGIIQNQVKQVLFSSQFEIDPANGNYLAVPNDEDAKKVTKVIPIKSKGKFKITNLEISTKRDAQEYTIVDAKSEKGAVVVVNKSKAENGIIDVGNIELSKLYKVTGKITFPDFIKPDDRKMLVVSIAYQPSEEAMYSVGFSQIGVDGVFTAKLPNGKYIFFFDAQDKDGNWRRVRRSIVVQDGDFAFSEPVLISIALDDLIKKQTSLETILGGFDLKDLPKTDGELLNQVENSEKLVLMYFFAGYCGPCFSDNGVRKYLDLATKFPGELTVIGVHSDSYGMKSANCPQSSNEMLEMAKSKPAWQKLFEKYQSVKIQNPNVILIWQDPSIAKKLSIDGYPSMLLFQNGVFKQWFMGGESDVQAIIQSYLKN